jgi:hypothetical protein
VVPGEMRDLIRRMAAENQGRAPRIHGELLRLGFNGSERTVSRYLRGCPPLRLARGRVGDSCDGLPGSYGPATSGLARPLWPVVAAQVT